MNDDIETIGRMITKAVARVSRRETRRQLRKEAENLLLGLLNDSGMTTAVMDFLDAKEKAQEKEPRAPYDENWECDDPRWDAVNALDEAIEGKYGDAQMALEFLIAEHFAQFYRPSLDELLGGRQAEMRLLWLSARSRRQANGSRRACPVQSADRRDAGAVEGSMRGAPCGPVDVSGAVITLRRHDRRA